MTRKIRDTVAASAMDLIPVRVNGARRYELSPAGLVGAAPGQIGHYREDDGYTQTHSPKSDRNLWHGGRRFYEVNEDFLQAIYRCGGGEAERGLLTRQRDLPRPVRVPLHRS